MDSGAGFEVNVLVQEAELDAARTHNIAAIRRLITSDETKDRALAGAVSTDESDVFARIHLQGTTTQHVLDAVRFVNVSKAEKQSV